MCHKNIDFEYPFFFHTMFRIIFMEFLKHLKIDVSVGKPNFCIYSHLYRSTIPSRDVRQNPG